MVVVVVIFLAAEPDREETNRVHCLFQSACHKKDQHLFAGCIRWGFVFWTPGRQPFHCSSQRQLKKTWWCVDEIKLYFYPLVQGTFMTIDRNIQEFWYFWILEREFLRSIWVTQTYYLGRMIILTRLKVHRTKNMYSSSLKGSAIAHPMTPFLSRKWDSTRHNVSFNLPTAQSAPFCHSTVLF